MGLRNLFNRKARTALTVLGVLIGTAAIIVMMSLGVGMNEANLKAVEQYGDIYVINVSSYYAPPPDESGIINYTEGMLNDSAIATMAEFPEVEAATPIMRMYYYIVSGKYKAYGGDVIGVSPKYMATFFDLKEGRLLEENDTNVAVFGMRMPYFFYNMRSVNRDNYWGVNDMSGDPIVDIYNDSFIMTNDWSYGERKQPGMESGSNTKPVLHKFTGVGMLDGDVDIWGQYDTNIIVNIEWLKKCAAEDNKRQGGNGGGSGGGGMVATYSMSSSRAISAASPAGGSASETLYDSALVKVYDSRDVKDVMKKINELGLGAYSPLDMLQYMEETTNAIQLLLGGIAAVSLLVAAIGIANTMVMSVYERTKEIAVMKVLGCRLGNIGVLFMFEAALIGLFGGIIGVGFSKVAASLLNKYGSELMAAFGGRSWNVGQDMPPVSIIPPWLIGLGLLFATVVGIISGFLPARRAMKISIIQAIHN